MWCVWHTGAQVRVYTVSFFPGKNADTDKNCSGCGVAFGPLGLAPSDRVCVCVCPQSRYRVIVAGAVAGAGVGSAVRCEEANGDSDKSLKVNR